MLYRAPEPERPRRDARVWIAYLILGTQAVLLLYAYLDVMLFR